MNETSYIDMANNLTSYLEKYCGVADQQRETEKESVEDVLTSLIHMNAPKENQEGGMLIDEALTNLTGGSKEGKDKKETVEISFKNIDPNLLEGGDVDKMKGGAETVDTKEETKEEQSKEESKNETKEQETKEEPKEETKNEDNKEQPEVESDKQETKEVKQEEPVKMKDDDERLLGGDSDSDDEMFGGDYSDSDDDDGDIEIVYNDVSNEQAFEQFVKHYTDKELPQTLTGGDNAETKRKGKIQILSMFPYLLRY